MNNIKSLATIFSNSGIMEFAAKQCDLEILWSYQDDPRFSLIHEKNHPDCLRINKSKEASVLSSPDWLHASPRRINFSSNKTIKYENRRDGEQAKKIVEVLKATSAPYFSLDNLVGYKKSQSLKLIIQTLYQLRYWVEDFEIELNRFGIPQTQTIYFLIAYNNNRLALPPELPEVGWYEVLHDLIPELPKSRLGVIHKRTLEFCQKKADYLYLASSNPQKDGGRSEDEPAYSIRSLTSPRIFCPRSDQVYALDIPALARLHTIPPEFQFCPKIGLSREAIVNSLPCKFVKDLILINRR